MFKLIQLLLHLVHVASLGVAEPVAAGFGQLSTGFNAVGVAHLLEEAVDLLLVDGGGVDIVQGSIQLLRLHV